MNAGGHGLLEDCRVLDLTDERGYLCGKILADLGAEVIKVESPGGDAGRSTGPFYHDVPDPTKSLYWFAYNCNKRGITLNVECAEGQALFKRLARTCDIVLESFPPGHMDRIGLGYAALSAVNPRIILASITPYGQEGPYSGYKASDLGIFAASGYLGLCGERERPPVRIGFPQSYFHSAGHAAIGVLIAYYHCQKTGEGQYIDVSAHESLSQSVHDSLAMWFVSGVQTERAGLYRLRPPQGLRMRSYWHCKDGTIYYTIYSGLFGARANTALLDWMGEDGLCVPLLQGIQLADFDLAKATPEQIDEIQRPIGEFFSRHALTELCSEALKRRLQIFPVNTIKELREYEHLAVRDYWMSVEHDELGASVTYPGGYARIEGHDYHLKRAPLVGEHNLEVYRELGLRQDEISDLQDRKVV